MKTESMIYRKNELDAYIFDYFPDNEIAIANYTRWPPPGNTGVCKTVVTLEGIKSSEEAFKKLNEAVDKIEP